MKFRLKEYKITKTKDYFETNPLFFFFNGINQNSNNWVKTEQKLKNQNLNYYKACNKTSKKIVKNSIYKNLNPTITNITFFIKPTFNNVLIAKNLFFDLEMFIFLALKLNNKIYSFKQLKYLNSLDYHNGKILLYQFNLTNTKFYI